MIRQGFALAGRTDARLIRGIAFKVIEAFFQGAPIGFLYLALQELFADTLNPTKLLWVVVGLGVCLLLQGLAFYRSTIDVFISTYALMADMRLRLGEHLRRLPMGFFTTRKSGDLNAVLTVDVGQVEQVFTHIYALLVAMIALPVFVATILFLLDWRMALATVATIPIAIPAMMWGQRLVRRGGELRAQAQINVIARVIEYVQGIQVLKACRLVGARFTQLERALADFRRRSFELEAKPVWDVNDGEVRIGGRNIKELRTDRLLSYISMVFQDVYLFHDTVLNNIRIGHPGAAMDEVIAAARAAQCHEFIMRLPQGYDTMVGEGGATLSGGEKQRISIARAILKNAPVVLLDEATASLDPENEALIQQGFQVLVRAKTLVVIAHRLPTIRHADQILVIDKGRIVERGKHDDLVALDGLYAKLWREQEHAHGWKVAA